MFQMDGSPRLPRRPGRRLVTSHELAPLQTVPRAQNVVVVQAAMTRVPTAEDRLGHPLVGCAMIDILIPVSGAPETPPRWCENIRDTTSRRTRSRSLHSLAETTTQMHTPATATGA